MWIKRPGYFIVVRFRIKGRRRYTLPVFLPVLETALDAAADLAWLLGKAVGKKTWWSRAGVSPEELVEAGRRSLAQLRRLGRYRFVDIDVDGVEVSVDLV